MSPVQAMERSYTALKQSLRAGDYAPGYRLEATRIADELGVSMTPVRDALNRLVGERLVEASAGEGFHAPRLGESALRELYEWNSALAIMATRMARTLPHSDAIQAVLMESSLADATAACFELLARLSPNQELVIAISNASERLHPFRIVEEAVLAPVRGELKTLLDSRQPAMVRRYHLARVRAVSDLVRARAEL
jgi:DNA-binding GntR family transcriptional regulator